MTVNVAYLAGANHPTNCSFARHFVGKMAIRCDPLLIKKSTSQVQLGRNLYPKIVVVIALLLVIFSNQILKVSTPQLPKHILFVQEQKITTDLRNHYPIQYVNMWSQFFFQTKSGSLVGIFFQSRHLLLHPRKWTCPLKRGHLKRKVVFQPLFFRGYLSFWGSISTFQTITSPWPSSLRWWTELPLGMFLDPRRTSNTHFPPCP